MVVFKHSSAEGHWDKCGSENPYTHEEVVLR